MEKTKIGKKSKKEKQIEEGKAVCARSGSMGSKNAAEEARKEQRVLAAEAGDRRTGVQPKQTGKSGVYLQREQGMKKGHAAEETEKQYVFAVAEKSRAAGAGLTD